MNACENNQSVLLPMVARVDACAALVRLAETEVAQKLAKDDESSKLDRALRDLRMAHVALRCVADELRGLAQPPTPNVLDRVLAASDIASIREAPCNAPRPGKRLDNGTRAERGPEVMSTKRCQRRKAR